MSAAAYILHRAPTFHIGRQHFGMFSASRAGTTSRAVPELKNWRPISLLSNVYKILSRALNNRLNLIVNRVCSRAQKGFNDARYTQEVLINVIETIAHCNTNGVGGGGGSLPSTWPRPSTPYPTVS
jgi:hypothetical protein